MLYGLGASHARRSCNTTQLCLELPQQNADIFGFRTLRRDREDRLELPDEMGMHRSSETIGLNFFKPAFPWRRNSC